MTQAMPTGSRMSATMRMRLRHEIAKKSDGYNPYATEIAIKMQGAKITKAQVRNLQNLAYSTDKLSDISDLVKKQVGRDKRWLDVGEALLDALRARERDAQTIAQTVDRENDDLSRRVQLLLCRELIKHTAAHFLYAAKSEGGE